MPPLEAASFGADEPGQEAEGRWPTPAWVLKAATEGSSMLLRQQLLMLFL